MPSRPRSSTRRALDSGAASRAGVLPAFGESAEHVAAIIGAMGNPIGYVPHMVM